MVSMKYLEGGSRILSQYSNSSEAVIPSFGKLIIEEWEKKLKASGFTEIFKIEFGVRSNRLMNSFTIVGSFLGWIIIMSPGRYEAS